MESDSATDDCVVGGFYDAGDHVKFGLPLGFTVATLGFSVVKYKQGYQAAGQLDEIYATLRWAYDYIDNSWNANTQNLVVQIGDGDADHSFWGRPEDMTMNRPCIQADRNSPASDIAANYAAALATGYLVFSDKGENSYAQKLLSSARSLYDFAKSNRGIFQGASPFYTSSGDTDELGEAAAFLYKATGESGYLNDARQFTETWNSWAYSWDDKKSIAQVLIFEATNDWSYQDAIDRYFRNNFFESGGMRYTPCGLAWRLEWGPNRYAANSAFIALLAADAGIMSTELRRWAVEQINYMLGDNNVDGGCFSFVIGQNSDIRLNNSWCDTITFTGYGNKYPLNPHHRGASCPDKPAPCTQAHLNSPDPSPQTLYGALVGGPDANDNYQDVRTDYVQNEVALDYNAGFQAALAGIVQLESQNRLPSTNNRCPCNN